ncbi:prephenate dehydratase domain-containing protein [Sphingosinicella humi]|uniref:prephenate dehydratase n=1 Tax=Allosphingosinicella humi TaxID=2068657 RepID=A0A2U2J4F0_9SPHN|nr:prephenate dehydratase domain-containing protein [Sphingosinicella humi]PWG03220.1 prephenate dehydratase [Sphingosinicella humi]
MSRPTVAYQGLPGAFSHEACLAFLPAFWPIAKPSFAAVAAAVEAGEADLGILPIENSSAGPVEEAHRVLAQSPLATVSEHSLPIRLHLLSLPGARLEAIIRAISHPMALAQCAETLRSLKLATAAAANTAIAAEKLATGTDLQTAVLASSAAARTYGLAILRRDVHDRPDNATRFRVVGRPGDSA